MRHPFFLLNCSLLSNKVTCKKLLYHEDPHSLRVNLFTPLVLLFQGELALRLFGSPPFLLAKNVGHIQRPDLANLPTKKCCSSHEAQQESDFFNTLISCANNRAKMWYNKLNNRI